MSFDSKRFMDSFDKLTIKAEGSVITEAPLIEIREGLDTADVYSKIDRLVFDLDEVFEEFKNLIDPVYWPEFFSFLSWKTAEIALDLDEINEPESEGAKMLNLITMAFDSVDKIIEQASAKKEAKSIENIPGIAKAVKAVEAVIESEIPSEDRAEALKVTGLFLLGMANS